MSGLTREIIKWIQSLDLTWPVKTPKWDLANGFLVAEIFSWYYPKDINIYCYSNGLSMKTKRKNWEELTKFLKNKQIPVPEELIEGTMHCRPDAAVLLMERVYQILTNQPLRRLPLKELEFSDEAYQDQLPFHAKNTALLNVRNNLHLASPAGGYWNEQEHTLKADQIIHKHLYKREEWRMQHPDRFDRKPTLGELCPRSELLPAATVSSTSLMYGQQTEEHQPKGPEAIPLRGK